MANAHENSGPCDVNDFFAGESPKWEAIDFDLHCSRCGYNLRMLSRPKCTECGFEFEWRELVARQVNINPRLFEHGWRRNPVRAYLSAVIGPLRHPLRFWDDVSIHDKIRPRPLWLLILTAPLWTLFIVCVISVVFAAFIDLANGWSLADDTQLSWRMMSAFTPFQNSCYAFRGLFWHLAMGEVIGERSLWSLAIGPLCAALIILFLLLSLRETIERCRLRGAHMLRVVGYCASPAAVVSGAAILFYNVYSCIQGFAVYAGTLDLRIKELMLPGFMSLPFVVLLGIPLKRYLRIPTPLITAILLGLAGVLFAVIGGNIFDEVFFPH